ncbi:MAG: hypothetical protein ABIF88_01215 [archaeon]
MSIKIIRGLDFLLFLVYGIFFSTIGYVNLIKFQFDNLLFYFSIIHFPFFIVGLYFYLKSYKTEIKQVYLLVSGGLKILGIIVTIVMLVFVIILSFINLGINFGNFYEQMMKFFIFGVSWIIYFVSIVLYIIGYKSR